MPSTETPVLPDFADLWQSTLGWCPTPAQQAQLQQLYELVLEGNRQLNLTRITAPDDFWEKHLWDSLRGLSGLDQSEPETALQVIDIGTGAGFPGIPVAIAHPTWAITLLDSTRKKVAFLQTLIEALNLPHVTTLAARAEQAGHLVRQRETYDLALIRAVGSASACAEYALPLLRVGGMAVLYRGQWSEAEAAALQPALTQLGGELATVEAFATPLSHSTRHCIYLHKVASTPAEFPRAAGLPTQKPL